MKKIWVNVSLLINEKPGSSSDIYQNFPTGLISFQLLRSQNATIVLTPGIERINWPVQLKFGSIENDSLKFLDDYSSKKLTY